MKKKKKSRQETLWIPHDAVASSPGHPFYEELERVLREEEFDSFVESKCSPYYAKKQGRPSIPPGVYFRMLLIGYFERIDSERGICWRCSDSLSLRQFLGLGMEERTPDHSSLSRILVRQARARCSGRCRGPLCPGPKTDWHPRETMPRNRVSPQLGVRSLGASLSSGSYSHNAHVGVTRHHAW